jgi:hypothetical protein
MKTIKQIKYQNAIVYKWDNNRIAIMPDQNNYFIEFKTLSDKHTPRAAHKIIKGKIVCTRILISEEAARSICAGLMNQFQIKNNYELPDETKPNIL